MAVAEAESADDAVCTANGEGEEVARVKFLCSFGGSIMPRPLDGKLRYVGGETRIVSVARDVNCEDLMNRMRQLYDEVAVVKYQQPDEDLDALVSVVNDEDVVNMMEEYDKLGASDGFTKLRIFLFSESDEDVDPLFGGSDEGDRRYVDALNNVNDGFEYWRPQWGDSPRWSDSPRMSSVDATEPYLPAGLEGGGYASPRYYEMLPRLNTNHHMSPRYNSNQLPTGPRFNDLESPWGQACYSPGHHGYVDYQSPRSAVGYNMPYGEYSDNRMAGEYRCPPVAQPPMFEQMPRYHDNVVRIPPGTLTNHRAGFPVNILQGTNAFEGNVAHSFVVNDYQLTHIPTVGYPPRNEPGSLFHDQLDPRNPALNASPEDMAAYCTSSPHNHPTASHYYSQQGHSSIQRNNQCHALDNVGPQSYGNANPGYPRNADDTLSYPVQTIGTGNLSGSTQEHVGLDASSMLEYPHGNTLKLNTKVGSTVYRRPPPVPSRSDASHDTLNSSGSSNCQLEQSDRCSLEKVEKSGLLEEDKVVIAAQEIEAKDSPESSCMEQNIRGEEHGMEPGHDVDSRCLQSIEKPRNNNSQNDIVSGDSTNAFPESEAVAMAVSSVKEINRLLEQNLQTLNDAKLDEESVREMENLSVHQNLEWSSENEKISRIEPTKAEAEAISRGLQTIKTADLEEIRELGRGTYGSVYHGKWKGCDVAVKRIKASCFEGKPSERERLIAEFWNEALLLSSLHHPNVVAFYGIVRDGPDGSLATVTEFMINGSLKQFLKKKDRTIDRRKRLIIAMDASFGMEYLHGKNVVHFDLKCENLLVNMRDPQRPICKIGDLGLSKVKQRTQVSGGIRGTLPWMAPELLSGKNDMVSDKIDVYSFGVVMWELLTGDEPYADMHYGSIIGGIVNNTLRPQIPTWCDPEWKSLMESCWASDPAARPSFSEISHKLRTMATAMNIK